MKTKVAVLLASIVALDVVNVANANPCDTDVDVVIIGAGYAGIGAAIAFERYNSRSEVTDPINYVILEAAYDPNTNAVRPGGRGYGQRWIAGGEGNPLFEFLWTRGNPIQLEQQQWSDIRTCTQAGPPTKPKGKICTEMQTNKFNNARSDWWNAYECLQEEVNDFIAGVSSDDRSITDTLSNVCNWPPTSATLDEQYLREILEWYDTEYEFSITNDVTGYTNYPLSAYQDFQDKDFYISNVKNGASIVEELIQAYPGIQDHIYPQPRYVTAINWSTSPVAVTTAEETCLAPKVLVTVSQGVLSSGDITFVPPLSSTEANDKTQDMNDLFGIGDMPNYVEIQLKFKERFWGNTQFIFLPKTSSYCRVWQSLDTGWANEFFPNSNVLVCALIDDEFKDLLSGTPLSLSEADVNAYIIDPLKQAFGKTSLSDCKKREPPFAFDPRVDECDLFDDCCFRVFDTPGDPDLWHGSYSHSKVQAPGVDINEITLMYNNFMSPIPFNDPTGCSAGYPLTHSPSCCSGDNCRVHFAGK